MKCTSLFSLALIAACGASAVLAQTAASSAASSTTSMDCAPSAMKRHDHGTERPTGAAAAMSTPCTSADAASAPGKPMKRMQEHDHAKFHKNP